MPTVYPSLHCTAPLRLQLFKREASDPKSHWVRPMSWRDVRFATLCSDSGFSRGLNDGRPIWCGFHVSAYFRDIRDSHDIVSRLPRGWYTDTHCSDTAIGIIARISHGRFLAGYRWTSNDETVIFPGVFDDEDDAARAADSHAEHFAESAREDSERFCAMQDAETAADDGCQSVRKAWRTYKAARVAWIEDSARFWDVLDSARDAVTEALQGLRDARDTLADATRAYEGG